MHTKLPRTLERINVFHLMLSLFLMKRLRNYYTMHRMIDASYDVNLIRLDNVVGNIAPKAVDELNYCCLNKLNTENVASSSEYKLKLSLIILLSLVN